MVGGKAEGDVGLGIAGIKEWAKGAGDRGSSKDLWLGSSPRALEAEAVRPRGSDRLCCRSSRPCAELIDWALRTEASPSSEET